MSRWIRWSGLGVFAGLVALVVLVAWLLVDALVERAIEQVGSEMVGARVDLESADVSFVPLGVALHGLAVTNPDQPMSNAIEIERIAGHVASLHLLSRKVIVDELAVEGVRFGTQRATSGALVPGEVADEEEAAEDGGIGFGLPAFSLPDVDTLLASADLESVKLAESLQRDLADAQARWKERLDALPDEQKLAGYRKQASELGQGDALSSIATGARLAKEVQADLKALEQAAGGLEEEVESFQARMSALKGAPQRDLARIQEQIGLGGDGLTGVAARLITSQLDGYVGQAIGWYDRFSPMIERAIANAGADGPEVVEPIRGKGVLVRFREHEPLPDFLVRRARVSLALDAGDVQGEIRNLTPDQPVLGKPLEVEFASDALPGLKSLDLEGVFDHVRPDAPSDRVEGTIRGFVLDGLVLSEAGALPVTLARGLVDFEAKAHLEGDALKADLNAALANAAFETGEAEGPVAAAIADALASVDRLRVDARVRGALDAYDVEAESDVDRILKRAVQGLAESQLAGVQEKFLAGIDTKLAGPLDQIRGGFGGLGGLEQDLASRIALGDQTKGMLSGGGAKGGTKGFSLPGGFKLP